MGLNKIANKVQVAFKEKPSKALAMLGNVTAVDLIIKSKAFDEYNIEIVGKDYSTVEELMQGIKETKRAKYVFISDSALIGIEDGKYEVIKKIREKYPDIIIAMFFNDEKRDEVYKNWAYGYKVYHIYYANENGDFYIENIAKQLSENFIPLSNNLQQSEQLDQKEAEIKKKEKELEEKAMELKALEQRLAETESLDNSEENSEQILFLKEQIKKMQEAKIDVEASINEIKKQHELERQELEQKHEQEKKEYFKQVDADAKAQIEEIIQNIRTEQPTTKVKTLGCITIGVFSISPGAGSTFTAASIGKHFAMAGFPTAVVAYDGRKELKYIFNDYAFHIVPEEDDKKTVLLETINQGYNFVILDFGCLFPLSPIGKLEIGIGKISDRNDDFAELLRCAYKIAVGFSDPWHVGKLNFFIEDKFLDPMTSIFAIDGATEKEELMKCEELYICERDANFIAEILFEQFGLSSMKKSQEKTSKISRFFRKERVIESI